MHAYIHTVVADHKQFTYTISIGVVLAVDHLVMEGIEEVKEPNQETAHWRWWEVGLLSRRNRDAPSHMTDSNEGCEGYRRWSACRGLGTRPCLSCVLCVVDMCAVCCVCCVLCVVCVVCCVLCVLCVLCVVCCVLCCVLCVVCCMCCTRLTRTNCSHVVFSCVFILCVIVWPSVLCNGVCICVHVLCSDVFYIHYTTVVHCTD